MLDHKNACIWCPYSSPLLDLASWDDNYTFYNYDMFLYRWGFSINKKKTASFFCVAAPNVWTDGRLTYQVVAEFTFPFSESKKLSYEFLERSSRKLYIIDKALAWDIELGLFLHFAELLIKLVYMKELMYETWSWMYWFAYWFSLNLVLASVYHTRTDSAVFW